MWRPFVSVFVWYFLWFIRIYSGGRFKLQKFLDCDQLNHLVFPADAKCYYISCCSCPAHLFSPKLYQIKTHTAASVDIKRKPVVTIQPIVKVECAFFNSCRSNPLIRKWMVPNSKWLSFQIGTSCSHWFQKHRDSKQFLAASKSKRVSPQDQG